VVKRWVLLLPMIGFLSACAAVPTGPSVMVLPGVGKPFDQFQVDDRICRQYAQAQTGVPPGEARARSTVNTAAPGTLLGAGAGAAIGAVAGDPGLGAAVGAGSGLLCGMAVGVPGR
jgi:Glycine-zipper domain